MLLQIAYALAFQHSSNCKLLQSAATTAAAITVTAAAAAAAYCCSIARMHSATLARCAIAAVSLSAAAECVFK
jgi:hypothetical protein